MKIARTIGVETIQGPLIPVHGTSPMLSESFAESFGKSFSVAGEVSSGAKPDDAGLPGTKLMAANLAVQAGDDLSPSVAIEGAPGHTTNSHLNGTEQIEVLPGQDVAAANGKSISSSLKSAPSVEIVRIANEDANPQANPPVQPVAIENEGVAPLKEQPADPGKMPGMERGLLDALTTELNRNTKQAAGHSFAEIKGDLKSRAEGTQPKAAKKDGAEAAAAATTPAVDGAPAITVTALPHPIVTAVQPETLNKGLITDAASKDKDSLGSVTLAKVPSRMKGLQGIRPVAAAGSPNPQKTDSASEVSDMKLAAVPHETKSSAEHAAIESASISVRPEEKPHVALAELPPGVISTQVHAHTTPPLDNISPDSARPSGSQAGTVAVAPHLYAADETRTLTATPTTLEVGVPGGTHGWLKVRAELAGDGAVHASVSSNSSSGTEMLRRELPTLTSYLHEEQVRVSSLVVHAPSSAMDLSNLSGGASQHHEAGRDSMSPQEDGSRRGNAPTGQAEERVQQQMTEEDDGASGPLSIGYATGGGWLSIRA